MQNKNKRFFFTKKTMIFIMMNLREIYEVSIQVKQSTNFNQSNSILLIFFQKVDQKLKNNEIQWKLH